MKTVNYSDHDAIKELFMGKSVKKVADDKLILSDGSALTIIPNEGCGGCLEGWYDITELNECENIITNVVIEEEGYEEVFRIFVYAENRKINLLTVEGHDNGWYGSGYWINVSKIDCPRPCCQ